MSASDSLFTFRDGDEFEQFVLDLFVRHCAQARLGNEEATRLAADVQESLFMAAQEIGVDA